MERAPGLEDDPCPPSCLSPSAPGMWPAQAVLARRSCTELPAGNWQASRPPSHRDRCHMVPEACGLHLCVGERESPNPPPPHTSAQEPVTHLLAQLGLTTGSGLGESRAWHREDCSVGVGRDHLSVHHPEVQVGQEPE